MVRRVQAIRITVGFQMAVACIMLSEVMLGQVPQFKPGFNLFSANQDIQLGREAAAQVEQKYKVVSDPEVQAYISRIGQRLAATPQAGKFPYSFKVVNDPSVNAFALPGGPMFINSGLFKAAENEAQLAGVMAHEMSHVALRHGTHQASQANLLQIPAALLGAVAGSGGSLLGQLASAGVGLGFNSVLLRFSRTAEQQADLNGAQIMAAAGYNPIEMARFFEKLESQGGRSGPQFLSDHPNPGNRVKYVEDEVRQMPQRDYQTDSPDYHRVQSIVGGIPPSKPQTSQLSGAADGSAGDPHPSGHFKEYRGGIFSMNYPDNWTVFGSSENNAVTIAPRAGLSQDSGGNVGVAYGLMISYYFPPQGEAADLSRETAELIHQLQRSNPGMELRNRSVPLSVGGQSALWTTLAAGSPIHGQQEQDGLVIIARPEGLLYMIFVCPVSEAGSLKPTFDSMLRSVRFSN